MRKASHLPHHVTLLNDWSAVVRSSGGFDDNNFVGDFTDYVVLIVGVEVFQVLFEFLDILIDDLSRFVGSCFSDFSEATVSVVCAVAFGNDCDPRISCAG